jgi:hypothetical protein
LALPDVTADAATAASRLAALGPNELRAAKRPPVIRKVLAQFTNLFALVLLGASVITFASYLIQSPRDAGSLELAVAILAVVLLNGAIGFFQEYSLRRDRRGRNHPLHRTPAPHPPAPPPQLASQRSTLSSGQHRTDPERGIIVLAVVLAAADAAGQGQENANNRPLTDQDRQRQLRCPAAGQRAAYSPNGCLVQARTLAAAGA